jgi:hypothetical protein
MRNIKYLLLLLVFSACRNQNPKDENQISSIKEVNSKGNEYPRIVDSLKITDLYDSARWIIYCMNCDDTCLSQNKNQLKKVITVGETELVNGGIKLYNDTIDFTFKYYMDTSEVKLTEWGYNYAGKGVQYKLSKKRLLSVIGYTTAVYMHVYGIQKDTNNRMFVPLQPEVIKYINENKNKLNPWFYNEAKRRGVIKE